MKLKGNSVIAAALVGIAIVLGSWLGSAAPSVSADAVVAKQGSDGTENQGPPIPLPRAIRSMSPPLSQQDVAAAAAKGTSQQQGSSSPEIVPGGPPPASAIERLWETNANQGWKVRATPLTRPNWYITGVVQRGDKTQVIVQFDGEKQPRFLKIGDTLPGGGKLAWVRDNAIGVVTPDKKIVGVSVRQD